MVRLNGRQEPCAAMAGEDNAVIIDAHHHLWRLDRGDYDWLTPDMTELYRDFEPRHLTPLMEAVGAVGGIVVQAAATTAETAFLLDLAKGSPGILGVIGWADFGDPDALDTIARLAREPLLKGLRPMLQDLEDDDFILRPPALAALESMAAHDLRFEALVRPRHLERLIEIRRLFPDLAIIVNHGAKPDIAGGAWSPWADTIARLAGDGRTLCKLSGLITEAGADWTVARLKPYVDHILEHFGPGRVMWGSDWPVCRLAGDYQEWVAATLALLEPLPASAREAILGGNARRVYGLD